ncbi:hypothetical protein IFM89_032533 [Coptis chinensis]|uniref:Uncharacterized protein n=1 Tax=Coptis chinensis TaxID=261450 RepID=A0A835ISL5_9MAGN|nr:hypothetical protein IFM89_032533 [Coptis chinensis]
MMTASWLTVDKCIRSFSNFTEETLKPPPKATEKGVENIVFVCFYFFLDRYPICCNRTDKLQSGNGLVLPAQENSFRRRRVFLCSGATLIASFSAHCGLIPLAARAEENALKDQEADDDDKGLVGAITSLFDPNEKTKSGKVLPKNYLKTAREVVNALRESLKEDPRDNAKFRRTADAAKEAIREYLNDWRGQKQVETETNIEMKLEKKIAILLYSQLGPSFTPSDKVTPAIFESYVALVKAIRSLASFYSKSGPSAPLPEEVKADILDDLQTAEAYL